jgi:hypothetical protein
VISSYKEESSATGGGQKRVWERKRKGRKERGERRKEKGERRRERGGGPEREGGTCWPAEDEMRT